ncbi:MAG: thioesterase family protein [Acidimicrobiales bacterium]|nr:thioesterase family protein [Acidimicrobiales bacterium]
MGDLGQDTAVRLQPDGTYEASLSADWEIWGPMGGYVAAIALRAAGTEADGRRPAAFSCHYLSAARFEPVQIKVETRRGGRSATSHRVEISQDGKAILDASVWSVAETEGLEHDETIAPDVASPDELPEIGELLPPDTPRPFPFWENFDAKPLDFESDWPPDGPRPARWREWLRFTPTAMFDDPWIDAARSVILVDLPSWPAAHRPHAWTQPPYVAPTLDLNVAFHQPTSDEDWLLCEGTAPLSTGGIFGWTARVWSPSGKLHASGGGQCLYRKVRPPT